MPVFDEKHTKILGCFIVWDGITRPGKTDDGQPKYNLKVVVPPGNPDLDVHYKISMQCLQDSQWRGVLPPGGRMAIGTAKATEFNGMFTGYAVLNCNTQRMPDVYDENGKPLDPMQYSNLLYGGQQVDVLVHCYDYDNINKGIATGLDGFSIIASTNQPRQNFGGAGVDTSQAFGGQQQNPAHVSQQPPPASTMMINGVMHENINGNWVPQQQQQQPSQAHDFLPANQNQQNDTGGGGHSWQQ